MKNPFRKTTVSSVLAGAQAFLDDLQHVSEHHRANSAALQKCIEKAVDQREISQGEASKAETLRARFESLLNV